MIINPLIIYLIGICEILGYIIVFSFIVSLGSVCFYWIEGVKIPHWIPAMAIISAILLIFIPSKETATKMYIASFITEENYNVVKSEGEDFIDYIYNKINEETSHKD